MILLGDKYKNIYFSEVTSNLNLTNPIINDEIMKL